MQVMTNFRYWMKRVLFAICETRTNDNSDGHAEIEAIAHYQSHAADFLVLADKKQNNPPKMSRRQRTRMHAET